MTSLVLVSQDFLTHSTALGMLLLNKESVVMYSEHHGSGLNQYSAQIDSSGLEDNPFRQ